ncbi:MAG: DEAD/DEAH box helicase family protein [Rickettsiales bacterium]
MSLKERILSLSARLAALEAEKNVLLSELDELRKHQEEEPRALLRQTPSALSPEQKISLFMDLFQGRPDVFPKRWDNAKTGKSGYAPACHNEWVRGVCNKPKVKCSEYPHQAFVAWTQETARKHLRGEAIFGVYPMLADETCRFLAADFDKEHWQRDAAAFLETCKRRNVPAALERSRSGNGGHVWIFFDEKVAASDARKMGATLLTETMERRPEIGFESYDRFFPSQDTMPAGGFGNLIALPLQRLPREKGNSMFLDENFEPYPDQWEYLASVRKMTRAEVGMIVAEAERQGRILGVRMPLEETEENDKPWTARPSRVSAPIAITQKLPDSVEVVFGNQLYIPKADLPPPLINRLIRLAAFQNPEFYMAQSMRLSTFGKPRIIACAEDFPKHIGLPRGCADEAIELLRSLHVNVSIDDQRNVGSGLETRFLGTLSSEQEQAAKAMLAHETGVLAATTAFGKTVVAARIIAERNVNTLVLVHRRQLLDQWVSRLQTFLDIPEKDIGRIGGGKRKSLGRIDVALIQSLARKNAVDNIVADYGHLVVDECHHLSAVSFEAVARAFKGKYVLGLTATATRKDGHHPIIFMQCGSIRYRVDAKRQAALRPFSHRVVIRPTMLQPAFPTGQKPSIQQLYAAIGGSESRNRQIFDDVLNCLEAGRYPLILTERKDHAASLAERFAKFCKNVVLLVGGQSAKSRAETDARLASIPDGEERLLIATGRYIGEGFDDARLDTLFLAMPVSWHGTLAQYAGRLHRLHHAKREVVIYDYVDGGVPMLANMAEKRRKGYERLGYAIENSSPSFGRQESMNP